MIRLVCVLTTECNLQCLHCLRDNAKATQLSLEDIKKAVLGAKQFGLDYVHFTGGEPFLYTRLPELFEFLKENGAQATFSSNGLLLSKNSSLIKKYRHNFKFINISLDGHTAEIHDAIRGKGAFESAMSAFEFCNKEKLPFGVTCCLNKFNSEYTKDLVRFAKKLKAKHVNFSTVLPCSNATENNLVLSESDRKKLLGTLSRLSHICSLDRFRLFYVPIFISEPICASNNIVMCTNQSLRTITIDVDGSFHFCCFLTVYDVPAEVEKRLRITSIRDVSFKDGVTSFVNSINNILLARVKDFNDSSIDKNSLDFNSCFYCNKKLGIA